MHDHIVEEDVDGLVEHWCEDQGRDGDVEVGDGMEGVEDGVCFAELSPR